MFYGDFVFKFFSLDSILFALFDILTLFQGRLHSSINKTTSIDRFYEIENRWRINFSTFQMIFYKIFE
ncbi:hypothetical protein [Leptospira kirschneri]|uniref:hypothetical protein n=1 Tax=Leptospira kirschneri TaxID=29507 RepID=UPI0039F2433E